MDNFNYENMDFKRLPKIPKHVIWQAVLMIAVRVLWGIIQPQNYFWMVLIIVNILGWMASYGWRMAIHDLRKWIDQITEEV
jgi:hypothetical protein